MFMVNSFSLKKCLSLSLSLILVISFINGCATANLSYPLTTKLEGLGAPRVLLMQEHIIRGNDSYSMDMVVEVSNEKLTVVGSSLGFRIFTLSYDGVTVSEGTGKKLPFYISNRLVIDDVMLVLSSNEVLKDNLPDECSMTQDGDFKNIYCRGRLTVSIKKLESYNMSTVIFLKRTDPDYQLNIIMNEVQ